MITKMKRLFANPVLVCGGIFLFSALSLMAALIAQFAYGLVPCELCILQRWPFGITAVLGAIGLIMLYDHKHIKKVAFLVLLCGVIYMIGGGLGFYHNGVEQHWWKSFLEGCSFNLDAASIEDLLAQIENAPAARCDEIPWADPVFGLSMAAWNMIISPLAAIGCALSSICIVRKANGVL